MGEHQLGPRVWRDLLFLLVWGDLSGSCISSNIVLNDTDAADRWDAVEGTESLVDVELVYRMTA